MPVAIIDIPSGLKSRAKEQLHKDVAEIMHDAYQIPDNRVYLREWAAEHTSFDGVVGAPFRPICHYIVPPILTDEHEVIDEELRASSEEIGEGRYALVGLESVLLVHSNPGQLLPPPRQLVAAPGQLLLGLEQLQPDRKPLFTVRATVGFDDGKTPTYKQDPSRESDGTHVRRASLSY
jgi:hypothetical protein